MNQTLSLARAVADAVLYEGYLLYPYRASSQKNQSRWQFGMLGPPGAAASGTGEETGMFADCLVRPGVGATIEVHVRFLQLQTRTVERFDGASFSPVERLDVGAGHWISWDEAAEHEVTFGPFTVAELESGQNLALDIPDGVDVETLSDAAGITVGRLVRRRRALHGSVRLTAVPDGPSAPGNGGLLRLRVAAENSAVGVTSDKRDAVDLSFIGTHLLLVAVDAEFVSLLEPGESRAAAASCVQHRCWPVLAGPEGRDDVLLISPIILYDHPAVAPESSVALYDSTEIDEILTLRVLTLTDDEKAEARMTDPRAAAIIDRCEAMTAEELQDLHGALRNPHAFDADAGGAEPDFPTLVDESALPWWDPAADASVQPDVDVVVIDGVPVARGSRVRIHPQRRADAQDLFFAGEIARVAGVHFDVDGSTHVAVLLDADPAADLHEWYGRYLYFSPDELEPLRPSEEDEREETES